MFERVALCPSRGFNAWANLCWIPSCGLNREDQPRWEFSGIGNLTAALRVVGIDSAAAVLL